MTPVLMIAYYFPPIGGAGVQRAVKFARHLPACGYLPVVLTGPGKAEGRWTPEDASLADDVPPSVPVHRVAFQAPPNGLHAKLRHRLGLESPWDMAWRAAVIEGGEPIARAAGARLIFATMSPFASAQAAAELGRRLGLPWVADLRDPWALDEMRVYLTAAHRAIDRRRMGRDLASAEAIVMNTPESRRRLLEAFPHIDPDRVDVITNGYDAEDFRQPVAGRSDGFFTVVHGGYLHADMGLKLHRDRARRLLGGVDGGVDFMARSHVYLLRALEAWSREDASVPERVRLVLIGALTPTDKDIIDRSPVSRCVVCEGYLPHLESVRRVRSADLLFLPLYGLPAGRRAGIVPGKTYEYIASGRRILAALPEGDARDFAARAGTALLCRPDDVEGMVRCLKQAFEAHLRGEPPPAVPPEALRPFERQELTRRLADVFQRAMARSRP
jgi:glycosyltransferase involved in cell wall biosynthesis